MNNHGHKEPPLRDKVNHIRRIISNITTFLVFVSFALIAGYVFASAV